ncbi:ATPase domain-containing protein [Massilia timonae]|uniref:ATPase domain-containing protein n=1 Tax=Massilia timonae TaxID=47229 RepID=UPI0028D6B435|nr:ATPase domain-containing protein [Massilia timonae]
MTHCPQRIVTGIPELDAVLHGGLLRDRIHLIEGRPGTGKTTLGLRYLIEGVAGNEAGLYLSLSEAEDELRATAANHGWSLDGVEIVDMIPLPPQPAPQSILLPTDSELAELVNRIADRVEQTRPARVVIDSMVEIRLLARDSAHYRRQIIALRERLSRIGATVLLLDDITSDGREYELQSAVHGVISLEYVERSFGAARRRLHVVKMRGGSFQSGWHDYKILPGEILVFPSLIAQEHHRPPQRNDIVSGIATLDELAGGPLVAGSSTMVLGPSGVGKTTLALQYARSAVRSGLRVAYFNFDESESTLRSRLVADMGEGPVRDLDTGDAGAGDAADADDDRRFFLRRVNPSRISPGEFIWSVRRLVEDHDVKLVIIDSINSYLDVIRQEKSLLPQMNELFSYLSNMSVSSIVVGAHSQRLDTSKEPDAVSIITDNIISLRYYERDHVVCKALCVLKKRQGPHVHEIRELELTDEGIRIGDRVQSKDDDIGVAALGA